VETNIHSKNNTRLLEKKKRHKAIHRLLNEGDIGTHDEIVSKLREEEIFTSQTTIHRDLEQLGIKKNIEGYFKPSHEIKQRFHLETLRELIVNSDSTTCSNVQTFFIKTEKELHTKWSFFYFFFPASCILLPF